MNDSSLLEMLKSGVHFGHQTSRWHPKMKQYIYTVRNGVYIIDLEKTAAAIQVAQKYIQDLVAGGGTILFIGTKRQAKAIVKKPQRKRRCRILPSAGLAVCLPTLIRFPK